MATVGESSNISASGVEFSLDWGCEWYLSISDPKPSFQDTGNVRYTESPWETRGVETEQQGEISDAQLLTDKTKSFDEWRLNTKWLTFKLGTEAD